MKYVCPTVTAENPHVYREQMERAATFAQRVHVDFADGEFAPTKLVSPEQAWIADNVQADLHVMFQRPAEQFENLISLKPRAIIVHAEADGDLVDLIRRINACDIVAGIALLQDTLPGDCSELITEAKHVLLFGGKLGYHGGVADLSVLQKIDEIRAINPSAEFAWDGGVNANNARQIVDAGVTILNVGGFIQKSATPQEAYAIIDGKINA